MKLTSKLCTQLRSFLVRANEFGYANPNRVPTLEDDLSKSLGYSSGQWGICDSFFGGDPFGGREIVYYRSKPLWIMVYYGRVFAGDPEKIYSALRRALRKMPEYAPFRGPEYFYDKESGYEYRNSWGGDLEYFTGTEYIVAQQIHVVDPDSKIYVAHYSGGFVDLR